MHDFNGKTAVITGAASGIGRALVDRCLTEGMNVVLADIEQAALDSTMASLQQAGARVHAQQLDVSNPEQMDKLARITVQTFGAVHLLFNNAGVGAGTTAWQSTLADWTWVMGVNLWGVIHGIRAFVPIMETQKEPGFVVNTASIAGLIKGHHSAAYATTKHAVVALTEQLAVEFERTGCLLKAAVLCPSWVNTRINEGGRNRPGDLRNPAPANAPAPSPDAIRRWEELQAATANATPPSEIADFTFAGLRAGKLYLLPHPESHAWVRRRFDGITRDF